MKRLSSSEMFREKGVEAAVAYMVYKLYSYLPSHKIDKNGFNHKINQDYDLFIDNLSKARTVEDVKQALNILLEKDIISGSFQDKNVEVDTSLSTLYNKVGINLFNFLHEENFLNFYYFARMQVGESQDRIKREVDRKNNTNHDEEFDEYCRQYDLINHKQITDWQAVKLVDEEFNKPKETKEQSEILNEKTLAFIKKFNMRECDFLSCLTFEEKLKGIENSDKILNDISEALNIPKEMIGFYGSLAFSYGGVSEGSLGTYSTSAHCLYANKDFTHQIGSHEWFHALDYDLSIRFGNKDFRRIKDFEGISSGLFVTTHNNMESLKDSIQNILNHIYKSKTYKQINSKSYLPEENQGFFLEMIKEVYVKNIILENKSEKEAIIDRVKKVIQALHNGLISEQLFADLLVCETPQENKETENSTFSMREELAILAKIYKDFQKDENPFEDFNKDSLYLTFSKMMDKSQTYFSNKTELFARLGEKYTLEKLGLLKNRHDSIAYPLLEDKVYLYQSLNKMLREAKDFYQEKKVEKNIELPKGFGNKIRMSF